MIDALSQVLEHAHHAEEAWYRRAFWVSLLAAAGTALTHALGVTRALRDWLIRRLQEDQDD